MASLLMNRLITKLSVISCIENKKYSCDNIALMYLRKKGYMKTQNFTWCNKSVIRLSEVQRKANSSTKVLRGRIWDITFCFVPKIRPTMPLEKSSAPALLRIRKGEFTAIYFAYLVISPFSKVAVKAETGLLRQQNVS